MKSASIAHLLFVIALVGASVGCGEQPLKPLSRVTMAVAGYGKVDAHFCTAAPSPAKQNLKYLYILDHSSSNQPGFSDPLNPGDVSNTDPQGSRRYGPLVNFTKNLVAEPNTTTFFGLIDFNDIASQPRNLSGFTQDSAEFIDIVTKDWIGGGTAQAPAPNDHGFTNYQSALDLAYQLIRADVQAQAAAQQQPIVKSSYVVIFVSDGIPVIATPSGPSPTYTQTFSTDIQPVIQSLMNLKYDPLLGQQINSITVNTAYYSNGTQLVAAQQLLQQMANLGNGQYLSFESGENILYQQFAPPPRNIRNILADIFIENMNAAFWTDGSFGLDSDGDGLQDYIELQLGSNPSQTDSDGNGVNDLVEYRTKGKPCLGAGCSVAQRDSYSVCAGYSPVANADGSVTFRATANDGLNDCEKFVLGANSNMFNTNGNLIPDATAFRAGLPIIPGSGSSAFTQPFNDGFTNYMKMKTGLPVQVSAKTLLDYGTRTQRLTSEPSPSPEVDCYHLEVDNVQLAGRGNKIKVMLVQNSSALQDKPFLQSAVAVMAGNGGVVSFQPTDFK